MAKSPIRITFFIIALLIVGIGLFFFFRSEDPSLTLNETIELIEAQYGSAPTEITLKDGTYYAVIKREDGLYEIEISEETGTILSLVPVEDNSTEATDFLSAGEARERVLQLVPTDAVIKDLELKEDVTPPIWAAEVENTEGDGEIDIHAKTGEELRNTLQTENGQQSNYITEQEAIDIALREINGVVDDVDLEDADGRMVYEVEIEDQETDEDVTIIIDAVTGQIIQFEY